MIFLNPKEVFKKLGPGIYRLHTKYSYSNYLIIKDETFYYMEKPEYYPGHIGAPFNNFHRISLELILTPMQKLKYFIKTP